MNNFDLESFLKNYKPKSLVKYLQPYMTLSKLRRYHLLEDHNKSELIVRRTYVKYIKIDQTFKKKKLCNDVKTGGILIGGGIFQGDKFLNRDDVKEWKYLMLKFDPSFIIQKNKINQQRLDKPRIFFIKMNNNYIFFRRFVNDKRSFMENVIIEFK